MTREISLLELLQAEQDAVSHYNQAVDALEILYAADSKSGMVLDYSQQKRAAKDAIRNARVAIKQHLDTIREMEA